MSARRDPSRCVPWPQAVLDLEAVDLAADVHGPYSVEHQQARRDYIDRALAHALHVLELWAHQDFPSESAVGNVAGYMAAAESELRKMGLS